MIGTNGEFSVQRVDTRVEPKERIKREEELVKANLRVREDRAGLVVERAVAILTEIPLIRSIAAVFDHRLRPAARAIEVIAPANLLEWSANELSLRERFYLDEE